MRIIACAGAIALAGCEARIDETWLHVSGFKDGGTDVSVVETPLAENSSKYVTVELENSSETIGVTGGGVAIIVQRARVTYSGYRAAFPTYEYPLALYLKGAEKEGASSTGSVSLPVAPAQLKEWIQHSGGFPANVAVPFQVSAMVTFFAETEEGRPLETTAGLSVLFK